MNAIEKTKEILKGIDEDEAHTEDGWWETSGGVRFGADKLKEMLALVSQQQAELDAFKLQYYNTGYSIQLRDKDETIRQQQAEIEALKEKLNEAIDAEKDRRFE